MSDKIIAMHSFWQNNSEWGIKKLDLQIGLEKSWKCVQNIIECTGHMKLSMTCANLLRSQTYLTNMGVNRIYLQRRLNFASVYQIKKIIDSAVFQKDPESGSVKKTPKSSPTGHRNRPPGRSATAPAGRPPSAARRSLSSDGRRGCAAWEGGGGATTRDSDPRELRSSPRSHLKATPMTNSPQDFFYTNFQDLPPDTHL